MERTVCMAPNICVAKQLSSAGHEPDRGFTFYEYRSALCRCSQPRSSAPLALQSTTRWGQQKQSRQSDRQAQSAVRFGQSPLFGCSILLSISRPLQGRNMCLELNVHEREGGRALAKRMLGWRSSIGCPEICWSRSSEGFRRAR